MKIEKTEKMNSWKDMPFLDHLEELRWHLIRATTSVVVLSIIAFFSKHIVFHVIILGPSRIDFLTYEVLCTLSKTLHSPALCIKELPFSIQSRTMTGQFTMHIISSVIVGFIVAFPYIFWEIWQFIKPGLHTIESQTTRGVIFFVSLLFTIGILFGYFIVSPISIHFLSNYQIDRNILNEFDIVSYVSTVATLVLTCGIMFQLPIVIYFLAKAGLITSEQMIRFRKHAIVIILFTSAVITPPDIFSQLLISLPIFLLYQMSILIITIMHKESPQRVK